MKHVALLIETSGSYGRGLLRGIAKYNRLHGAWSTYIRPQGFVDRLPSWLNTWKGDGLLVRVDDPAIPELRSRIHLPIVNLRATQANAGYPFVAVDNAVVSNLAAEHLIQLGLRSFGFCGQPPGINPALDQRADFFKQAIKAAKFPCDTYSATQHNIGWEEEQDHLAEWIRGLPKPVGVMAANDERGLQVLDACRRCGAIVPDEVAVIGVDNDEALCDLSIPPLTSVDVNAEGVGYEAAALLDRLMSGKLPPTKPVKIAPRAVVVRRSTDVIASEDEDVNRAIRFIRERAFTDVQVADVLSHVGMSRGSLQHRMKALVGRTIHQEIQRVRLNRVQELLVMSELTIKQVARESGFASVQYMTRVFRAETGETPARYRIQRAR